jgi:hypothetical protein
VFCAAWTYSLFKIDKETEINCFVTLPVTIIFALLLYGCGFFNVFHWPQITWLVLTVVGATTSVFLHGQSSKTGIFTYLFTLGLALTIYIKGGAFQYFN